MQSVSFRRIVVASWLLIAAIGVSQTRAEESAGTLEFRRNKLAVSQVTFTTPASSEPSIQQPAAVPLTTPPATAPTIATAPAQSFPRVGTTTRMFSPSFADANVTSQTRQALGFYGGNSARATLSQLPRRTPIRQLASAPARRPSKPFEVIHREPTVSPYMNLHRDERDDESAPNYFAFVRPQVEQLEANRFQQREIMQLRGQVQGMSSTVAGPRYDAVGVPGTGSAARYMDTAQFYGNIGR